jgi:SnoaL-like polyketide cyclase
MSWMNSSPRSWQAKQGFTAFRSAFPDWREEIVDVVAEGAKVVGRFKCSGTHRGEMMGIPPTGRRQEVDEVYFLRVEDGKFVEFWGLEDNFTRMRQLGLLPPRPGALAHILVHYAKKLRSRLPGEDYLRRISLPRTGVNKGETKGRGI